MNSVFYHLRWSFIVLICGAVGFIGCSSSEESHDDEHLEHFVPAHKPKHFEELVEQLALRFPRLATPPATSEADDREIARQELSDIICWIPELAADSELIKADFDSAVGTGSKLAAVYAGKLEPKKSQGVDVAEFEPLIEELRKLVPKSQAQKERM